MQRDNKYVFSIIADADTKKAFEDIAKQSRDLVNKLGQLAVGAGAGLALITERTITAGAEMGRLAETVGVSSQALSEWQYAAKSFNIEGDKMADIFKDVSEKVGEFAAVGSGGATDLFEQLNLKASELVKLAPDQQLIKIGEALDEVGTRSERIAFMEMLAGDASRLLPLLEDNAKGLKDMQDEARELGISISDIDAEKLRMAKESMDKAQGALQGVFNKIAIEVAPIVEVLAEEFVDLSKEGNGAAQIIQSGFNSVAVVVGTLADGVHGLQIILKGLEVVGRGVNATLAKVFSGLMYLVTELGNTLLDTASTIVQGYAEMAKLIDDDLGKSVESAASFLRGLKGDATIFETFAQSQVEAISIAREELHNMMMEELPSVALKNEIDRLFNEIDALAQERTIQLQQRLANLGSGDGDGTDSSATQNEIQQFQDKLARMQTEFMTEQELLILQRDERLAFLNDKLFQELGLEEQAKQLRLDIWEDYNKEKDALDREAAKKEIQNRLAIADAVLGIMAAFGGKSEKIQKAVFVASKVIAAADAFVAGKVAVAKTMASLPYPANLAAAAHVETLANLNVAAIAASAIGGLSKGGAGGGGSLGSSVSANASGSNVVNLDSVRQSSNQSEPPEKVTKNYYIVNGDMVAENAAEWITSKQKDMIDNGDLVLISPESRNGLDLRDP